MDGVNCVGSIAPVPSVRASLQMSSYMILSALSGKGPLSPEVTSTALTALVCKPCQGGLEPSLLCALAVAQVRFSLSLILDLPVCDCELATRADRSCSQGLLL